MSAMTEEPDPFEDGIRRGMGRAEQFGLKPELQPELSEQLHNLAKDHSELNAPTASLLAEVLTIANLGRHQHGQPSLDSADLKESFNWWERIFNGLFKKLWTAH